MNDACRPTVARASRLFGMVFWAFCLWSQDGAAQEEPCRRAPPPVDVAIEIDPGEVGYDFGRSRDEIRSLAASRGGSLVGGTPLGLTVVTERLEAGATTRRYRAGPGWCLAPAEVTVSLAYADAVVHVDERYAEGSCERRAVLAHENRHVAINREQLATVEAPLRRSVEAAVADWGWRSGEDPDRLARRFQDHMNRAISAVLDRMRTERARANAAIDTQASYRELASRCENW